MKENEISIKVRYAETDQMGIVHHSNYFIWFEVGRTEFIQALGMKYGDMERIGVLIPLIECYCKFKTGAKYEDDLIIKTSIKTISPVKIEFQYDIFRQTDNKLLASGFTKHAFVNKEFRPTNVQKKFPDIWNILNR